MEQKQQRAHYDEFAEQFVLIMHEHWSDILLIINRQSPRAALLLRTATPFNLKRMNGIWHIQIMVRRLTLQDTFYQPRDNENVSQAIRLWAHSAAQPKLPRVTVAFGL